MLVRRCWFFRCAVQELIRKFVQWQTGQNFPAFTVVRDQGLNFRVGLMPSRKNAFGILNLCCGGDAKELVT